MLIKILCGCVITTSLYSANSFSEEIARNKRLDTMMYTINPEAKLLGPVYSDQDSEEKKSEYATELVKLLLKEAHTKGEKYLAAGDTQAYYAILVMALTIPMQEGLYIQYRRVEGTDVCLPEANNGDLVRKTGETNYSLFNQYFKTTEKPFLPNCEDVKNNNVTQIIRGSDGTDLSIMQVSIRWHFDDFLANKKYESVQATVDYGLGHAMKGFDAVYRNIGDYKCITETKFFSRKKKVNYTNLIRGVWAGQYNSGSISKTCRFDDFRSDFKQHDKGFENNLNKILDFNGTLLIDMLGKFVLESNVSEAVIETVKNLKEATNNRSAIEKILSL